GHYVTYGKGNRLASATAATAGTREQFTLTDAGAGRVALRASNGKFLRLNTTDNKLYADATNIGTDERFAIKNLSGSFSLQGSNGFYVSSEGGAADGLTCTRSYPAAWEYFQLALVSIDWVAAAPAPAAPQGFEAEHADDGAVLYWNPVSGASHYTVKRATHAGGPYSTIGSFLTEPEFIDRYIQSGIRYHYRVVANAGNVSGPASETVSLTISGLPTAWFWQDIGNVGIAGSASIMNDSITLQGSGADIWGNEDAFSFVSQTFDRDFVVTGCLVSLSNTDYWAKAGLMIRESNAANSKNVFLSVTPEGGGTRLQWRNFQGAETADHQLSGINAPLWLRILRSGDTFTAWEAADGELWTDSHAVTLAMNPQVLVGLAVTSHNNEALNTATFENVSLVALPPGTSSWNAFRSHWFTPEQLVSAQLSAPDGDANSDGIPNLIAYASGVSPWLHASADNGVLPKLDRQHGYYTITYTQLRKRFDFEFVAEISSDLKMWNSGEGLTIETETMPLDDIREQVTVRHAVPTDHLAQRFVRLRASLLP
ncbi:MAG: hypothetical protein ACO3RV_05945, partial [Luteolibacter sp.]